MKDLVKQISNHKVKRNKMSRVKIGKAKYGSTQKKFWKLKDGDAVYGILPPLGDLAADGKWSVYYKVHYGYKNAAGKSRPFQSCEVKNRKPPYMIEVPDAANERLAMLKGQLEKAKAAKDEKAKEALFKLVGGQKSLYNLDNNHYVNAIDLQGNVGVLKLRHKAKLALDEEIKALRKKNIDPLGLENRRYFVFSRSGSAMETTFKVSVYKKSMNIAGVGEVEQDVVHNLTDDVLDRLGDEAAQLDKIFKAPTSEEVAQIVKESTLTTGVSPNIDEILGFSSNGAATEAEEIVDEPGDEETTQEATAANNAPVATSSLTPAQANDALKTDSAPTPAPTPVVAPAQTVASVTTQVSTSTPVTAPKATQAAPPPTTSEKLNEMSDADFLKSLGIPV